MTKHTTDKCYKLHGYPPNFKNKEKVLLANQVASDQSVSTTFDLENSMPFFQEEYHRVIALIYP